MKKLRIILVVAFLGLIVQGAFTQQLPQLSQYQFNDYVINPAVAGSRDYFELRSGHRYQWVGIQDAPRTFTLSAASPIGKNMGVGGYIYTDNVGPTRRTGFQLSYAYHLKVTEDVKLSFALSGGLIQFLIDGSKITFKDPNDPVIDDQLRGGLKPDAKFGFYLYHKNFWLGGTVPQIFGSKVTFLEATTGALGTLQQHYYVSGGYRFFIGDDWRIEPSFLVKYVDPVPVKIDVTATIRYKNSFWLGASYRTNDAYNAMIGYWHKDYFQFGYSYDIITSNLRNYSSGSHELMLAITLAKKK